AKVTRDLTEIRRAQEVLRASEEYERLIVDAAHDAFVAMDEEGVITSWNRQAERTFGWPRDEAIGRSLAGTIVPERHRDAHRHGLKHFLATGEGPVLNRVIEITAVRRDGQEFPVELSISPLSFGGKHVFTSFIRDITQRKRVEGEVEKLNAELERKLRALNEVNRELEAFSYSVSHDLRAPLRQIDGFANLLAEAVGESVDPTGKHYLQRIREGARQAGLLIDDLLQ